jgi:hypothetical protein
VNRRSISLPEFQAMSAVSLHYIKARSELAEIRKIIWDTTADPAERRRLWDGVLQLLATP